MRTLKTYLVAICLSMLTGIIAFSVGVMTGDAERQNIALMRVHMEMQAAIRDGIPFYLKGSNIKIHPRRDGGVNIKEGRTQ